MRRLSAVIRTILAGLLLLPPLVATVPVCAQEVRPPEPPPEFNPASEPSVVAVSKVMPAVVNIATERIVRRAVQDPFDELFNSFFSEPANRRPREQQQKISSLGSGFLIDAEGHIITNQHVVERAADLKIEVIFSDGTSAAGRYIAGDPSSDLALIKVEARDHGGKPFPFINVNNVSPSLLGQTVLALGNPLGYNSSVSRGILSANDREITIDGSSYRHLVQTDAAINPGNSGGPLIDLAGRLVGISSVKLMSTPQGTPTQGLGFAIPAKTVETKVAEFIAAEAANPGGTQVSSRTRTAGGSAPGNAAAVRRLFGLQLQTLTQDLADAFGLRGTAGVLVSDVERNSPAGQAGLRQGMVIYKVGTYNADSPARIETLLKGVGIGTPVDFVVGAGTYAQRNNPRLQSQIGTVTLVARE